MATTKKVQKRTDKKVQKTSYEKRGVSADKQDVHAAVKQLGGGEIPYTFCKLGPDIQGDPEYVSCIHGDGSGSKSIVSYLMWKETGDLKVWRGTAVDAIVMNLDDMICSGITGPFHMTMVINRNKHLIPGEVITEIIAGAKEFCDTMKKYGVIIHYASGETADLGDQVRTITVDVALFARAKRTDIITTSSIAKGNIIVGLASDGKAKWETRYNSGVGSNGFTDLRHDLLSHYYKIKYPEVFSPETDEKLIYKGKHRLEEKNIKIKTSEYDTKLFSIGDLLTSPTRTYAPIIIPLLLQKIGITGIIHNSGGGQTKVLGHIQPGLAIYKDLSIFGETPMIFEMQYNASTSTLTDLHKSLNMGVRMEVYCASEKDALLVIKQAQKMNVRAFVFGEVLGLDDQKKRLFLTTSRREVVKYEK